MPDRNDKWIDIIVGVMIAILILFAISMVVGIWLLYWYGTPVKPL